MIDALDQLTVRASFRDGAVGAYETLLGRQAEHLKRIGWVPEKG